ncbi:putative receptor protein kinase ZmPK1 [Capsicum baccatum]|uniref:non-specific serine/threonine protein kinase n=1 Tax=Capsicum baccatum TaxID=33114 RepID=A0A2G2X3L6_CAPBA|nr:putative receptor protein kinase ZmPK1 [Capsicum baccatum]
MLNLTKIIRNGSSGFLLAIWFNKLEGKTIVWSANRNNIAPEGSKVELSIDGRLVLTDPNGQEIWARDTASAGPVYGAMLDTGNFVLATSSSGILWQSFDEPTDKILPGQVLNQRSRFVSSFSRMNASSGRFELFLDGDLALYTIKYPIVYWSTTTGGSGNQVSFNQSGTYLHAANGTLLILISSSNETNSTSSQFFQRAILESDGVFRHYVYPKRSSSGRPMVWSSLHSIPDNICLILPQHLERQGVACGFNSLCSMGTDRRPRWKYPKKLSAYQAVPGVNIRSFSYNELEEATNGFEEQLGTGAFSTGYKAVLNDDNGKIVAVMKLHKTVTEGEQGFLAEVNSIRRTNHKNLVQLLGFSNEGQHRLLVYEHMETGSLADLLFKDSRLS